MSDNFSFLDGFGGVYDDSPEKRVRNIRVNKKKYTERAAGGYRSSVSTPWLLGALNKMAQTRQAVLSLTPNCEIAVDNASAVFHGYGSLKEIFTAATAAVQGNSVKQVTAGASAVAAAATAPASVVADTVTSSAFNATTAVAATTVFGWRIRLTASVTNYAYRPTKFIVGTFSRDATTTLTVASTVSFVVLPRKLPVDLLVLSVSNAAGYFTIVPGGAGQGLAASTTSGLTIGADAMGTSSNAFVTYEGLNARDLISRSTGPMYDAEMDWMTGYEGIRDEA